jgi:hypothetical protein
MGSLIICERLSLNLSVGQAVISEINGQTLAALYCDLPAAVQPDADISYKFFDTS